MTTTRRLDPAALEPFGDQLRGTVLLPDEEGYDEARAVWNGMIDKHPAVIARCAGTADVVTAVSFGREHDLLVSVKGGGHNVAGKAVCDGGLMIDLSPMDSVRIDPAAKRAQVGPGASWADFDHEAQAYGLATTGGFVSTTGVAGLTLGGGIGYLARSYGLSADNLVAADVVTATGDLVRASEDEKAELLWGLRGGGGNFGIVTEFEFRLHEVGPEVVAAQVFHPVDDVREVLRFYREFTADAPDEVACYGVVATVPPEPPFPEAYHGEPTVGLVACHSGDVDEGRAALEPLGEFGEPILAVVDSMPYTALQQSFDDGTPKGERYYWKSHYVADIPDGAIDAVAEFAAGLPGPFTVVAFEPMGGAVGRVDPSATAYPHRDAAYNFGVFSGWSAPENDDAAIAWTRDFHEAMAPYSTGGVYTNYLDQDDDDKVAAAFRDNYDRLVELKNAWDPENLFRLNSNVEPTV